MEEKQETVLKPMIMWEIADKRFIYMMNENKISRIGSCPEHNNFVIQDNSVELSHAHITCFSNQLVILEPQFGDSYVSDELKLNNEKYPINCVNKLLKFRFGTINVWVWYEEFMIFDCDQCCRTHYRPFDDDYIDVTDSQSPQVHTG